MSPPIDRFLAVRVGPSRRERGDPAQGDGDVWYFPLDGVTAEAVLADLVRRRVAVRETWVERLTPVRDRS